jgi:hypothetical protein
MVFIHLNLMDIGYIPLLLQKERETNISLSLKNNTSNLE